MAPGAETGSGSDGAGSDEPTRWADEVAVRDELVALQEALLNAYRCRFDIDTEAVVGGCADGAPALAAAGPSVFEGEADAGDVAERDELIASQEALLNVYRCRFEVDTEAVVGGCRDGVPATEAAGEPAQAVLAVGSALSCAIGGDQAASCWDTVRLNRRENRWTLSQLMGLRIRSPDSVPLPGERFTAIAARHEYAHDGYSFGDSVCAIRVDESLACWGDTVPFEGEVGEDGVFPVGGAGSLLGGVPEGRFADVALGERHGCAIRVDESLVCWGADYLGRLRWGGSVWVYGPMGVSDAPQGRFRSVSTSRRRTCAIGVNLALACWGPHFDGPPRPGVAYSEAEVAAFSQPQGRFTDVGVGDWHACAIRLDRALVCWGHRGGPLDPPSGEFIAVASSYQYSCAIRIEQTIACWAKSGSWGHSPGFEDVGQLDPPEGRFDAIAAGPLRACAQRADGAVLCWGDRQPEPYATAPLRKDKADATPPPYQAVYQVPFGVEPVAGRQQQIAQWVEQAQAWYRDQTSGRHPLFQRDRNGDISVPVIVEETEEQSNWQMARDQFGTDVFLVGFYERPSDDLTYLNDGRVCGFAYPSFGDALISLHPPCIGTYGSDFITRTLAHELAHVLGAAWDCAPNYNGVGHVGDDPRDLLYEGPDGYGSPIRRLANRVLDVGRDDYFGHGRNDCWDIAHHPLLGME